MNPPICKLCGTRHWLDEEHKPGPALDKVRKVGADVLGYEKRIVVFPDPSPPESVTTITDGPLTYVPLNQAISRPEKNKRTEPVRNKRTRGRPRKWASEAERKRAYRERSKG
jgi:hypothetical protein